MSHELEERCGSRYIPVNDGISHHHLDTSVQDWTPDVNVKPVLAILADVLQEFALNKLEAT
jgi:hypothetical protein